MGRTFDVITSVGCTVARRTCFRQPGFETNLHLAEQFPGERQRKGCAMALHSAVTDISVATCRATTPCVTNYTFGRTPRGMRSRTRGLGRDGPAPTTARAHGELSTVRLAKATADNLPRVYKLARLPSRSSPYDERRLAERVGFGPRQHASSLRFLIFGPSAKPNRRPNQNGQVPGSGKSVRIGAPTGTRNVTIVSATLPVSFLSM